MDRDGEWHTLLKTQVYRENLFFLNQLCTDMGTMKGKGATCPFLCSVCLILG